MLCDIGGFNGTIFMISSFLLAHFYTIHFFYYTLVRKIFYIDLNRFLPASKINKITQKHKSVYLDEFHNADLVKITNRVMNYIRLKIPI